MLEMFLKSRWRTYGALVTTIGLLYCLGESNKVYDSFIYNVTKHKVDEAIYRTKKKDIDTKQKLIQMNVGTLQRRIINGIESGIDNKDLEKLVRDYKIIGVVKNVQGLTMDEVGEHMCNTEIDVFRYEQSKPQNKKDLLKKIWERYKNEK